MAVLCIYFRFHGVTIRINPRHKSYSHLFVCIYLSCKKPVVVEISRADDDVDELNIFGAYPLSVGFVTKINTLVKLIFELNKRTKSHDKTS